MKGCENISPNVNLDQNLQIEVLQLFDNKYKNSKQSQMRRPPIGGL